MRWSAVRPSDARRSSPRVAWIPVLFASLTMAAATVSAATRGGSLHGRVLDPQGRPVPGRASRSRGGAAGRAR